MSILVVQTIIKQWDKSQRTEQHIQAREQIPDRYPVMSLPAQYLFNNQVLLDQHGDDVMGNRVRYVLADDNHFIIDRFRFSLDSKILEYKSETTQPRLITILDDNWIQCRYDWRYKVDEGGFIYWLYEEVTLNACFEDSLREEVFLDSEPALVCHDLV